MLTESIDQGETYVNSMYPKSYKEKRFPEISAALTTTVSVPAGVDTYNCTEALVPSLK